MIEENSAMDSRAECERLAVAGYQFAMRKVLRHEWPAASAQSHAAEYDVLVQAIEQARKTGDVSTLKAVFRLWWDWLQGREEPYKVWEKWHAQ